MQKVEYNTIRTTIRKMYKYKKKNYKTSKFYTKVQSKGYSVEKVKNKTNKNS